MRWKDFLYYQQGEKIAVIILLGLILAALVWNAIVTTRKSNEINLLYNEDLVADFERFRNELTEKQSAMSENIPKGSSTAHESKSKNRSSNIYTEPKQYTTKESYIKVEKLVVGETIFLNEIDTTNWKKIPGIGSSFASRIVKYRNSLGGFANIDQLKEVYGIDSELFSKISAYIEEDSNYQKIQINNLDFQSLLKHPYLNYKQVQAIMNLRKKKGKIDSIREIAILDEFTPTDIEKLQPYLDFQ